MPSSLRHLLVAFALACAVPAFGQANVPVPGGAAKAPEAAASNGAPAAGASDAAAPRPEGPSPIMTIVMFGGIFVVFWLFVIRPQNKKMKEHQSMISKLGDGDRVVTQGGLLGTIKGFDESSNSVKLEIAPNVIVRVLRHQVAGQQGSAAAEAELKQKATAS